MNYQDSVKRILDITVASLLAIIFLPVWIIVPMLILISSPGPIVYKHRRVGKDRENFDMYKFRSMVINADDILHNGDKKLLKKYKSEKAFPVLEDKQKFNNFKAEFIQKKVSAEKSLVRHDSEKLARALVEIIS